MKQQIISCPCGQRVTSREVLRTDLYERPNGKDYVYVKYRCRHCKQTGETFIPERTFRWEMFEISRDEMSDQERESFAGKEAVSSMDVVDLHQFLKDEAVSGLSVLTQTLHSDAASRADAAKSSRPITDKNTDKKTDKNHTVMKTRDDTADK